MVVVHIEIWIFFSFFKKMSRTTRRRQIGFFYIYKTSLFHANLGELTYVMWTWWSGQHGSLLSFCPRARKFESCRSRFLLHTDMGDAWLNMRCFSTRARAFVYLVSEKFYTRTTKNLLNKFSTRTNFISNRKLP